MYVLYSDVCNIIHNMYCDDVRCAILDKHHIASGDINIINTYIYIRQSANTHHTISIINIMSNFVFDYQTVEIGKYDCDCLYTNV